MNNNILIVIVSVVLTILFLVIDSNRQIEIVKVGEIPKAFTPKSTENLINKPKSREKINPVVKSEVSDNTIYLTFDDGPSYLTNKILDILKEKEVAATFFVIGPSLDKYRDVVKRAYTEGHTVALHSNTHNYKYIYSSDDNYFKDLDTIKTRVYDITGVNSRIIRLPGGSSNTVSKKYNKNIMTRITNRLNDNSYYYFDWNVDSGDASGKLTKEQIYHNTIIGLHHGTNVVLMHDAGSKKTTAEALETIIDYGKDHGYTFARITKNTRTTHHHIYN